MTTGLITGVAVIKVMATGREIPFFTKLRKMGIEAQSQTGKQNPPRMATNMPNPMDLGNRRSMKLCDIGSEIHLHQFQTV